MTGSRTNWCLLFVLTVSIAFGGFLPRGARAADAPPPTFSETVTLLSRIEPGETFFPVSMAASADFGHVAYAAKDAQGMFAVMDQQRSAKFNGVAKGTPLFSNGQFHWAFVAFDAAKKARAFIDGRPEPLFDGIDDFVFSPDGSRWAYRAGIGGKQAVVTGGVAGPGFETIIKISGPVFSPDSRRMAYGALNGTQGFLVVDGSQHSVDGIVESIVFSPDGKRMAYALKKGAQRQVVCDGQSGPAYDAVASLTFSPDSSRLAYMARTGSGWVAMLDGKAQPGGDSVGTPLFSPDSKHFSYPVVAGKKWHMMADGVPGKSYDQLGVFVYSADSARLAYMAQDSEGGRIVVNETPGPAYDAVGMPVFSPDGAQLAYRAERAKKWCSCRTAARTLQPITACGVRFSAPTAAAWPMWPFRASRC